VYIGSLVVEGYTKHLPIVLTYYYTRKESIKEDGWCQEEPGDVTYAEKYIWSSKKNNTLWTTEGAMKFKTS